jgi:hypothetical protein
MPIPEKNGLEIQEIHKEDSLLTKALDLLPTVVFFSALGLMVPWFLASYFHIGVYLISFGFFNFINSFVVPVITQKYFAKKFTKDKQRLEMQNRLVSLVFNVSTGIPSYLVWVHMFPLAEFDEIAAGRTFIMDVFNAWSIGYVTYDFLTLSAIYGKGASLIQWHHVAEAMVCYSYVGHPELASLYLLSGGTMQMSSGILHIQRILSLFSNKPTAVLIAWKWFLTAIWAHSRLWAFPLAMYLVYSLPSNPVGITHGLLLLTGNVLVVMSAHWLYKIYHMKSLAF